MQWVKFRICWFSYREQGVNLRQYIGRLELEKIFVAGHSFGGASALLAASMDSRYIEDLLANLANLSQDLTLKRFSCFDSPIIGH